MKDYLLIVFLSLVKDGHFVYSFNIDQSDTTPQQIHLSFGEKLNDIVVTWSTFSNSSGTFVRYRDGGNFSQVAGTSTIFHEGRGQYIHRVTLKDLKYDHKYEYSCGCKDGWSKLYKFKTPPEGNDASVRALIYGDFGVLNAQTLPYLQKEIEKDRYDFILHVGDFAYNLDYADAHRGDKFMNMIEPFAAAVPYMTVPGNHEEMGNFTHYKSRFTMPMREKFDGMFYSWNIGPVHFVGVNTEAWYFYYKYGMGPLTAQLPWLIRDLEEAAKPENRENRPWIIVYGHRPMYYSNSDDVEACLYERTRVGIDGKGKYSLEPYLKKYGVDIVIGAHEHSYERLWPVYDSKVYNGSKEHPYVNPKAPVHIVTGAAGCEEKEDPFLKNPAEWSAFRSVDYGYTRFFAHNHSHIYFEQVSADKKGTVIDSFWVVKEEHAPYDF